MNSTSTGAPSGGTERATVPRLSMKQVLSYSGGDAANNLAFSLATTFLPLYLTDVALISPATVGLIFLVMRFVDAFTDVIMGSFVDRTTTRFGKFRPWIIIGAGPLVVLAVLNFAMPAALHGTPWAVVWAAVAYLLMGSVAYTAVNIPYGSLAAAMTNYGPDRARLALFRSVGSAVMQVLLALAISPAIETYQGDPQGLQSALVQTIIPLGILSLALYAFLFFTARENVPRTKAKVTLAQAAKTIASNRALQVLGVASMLYLIGMFSAQGILSYYTRDVLGDARLLVVFLTVFNGMILIVGWILPWLSIHLGRPRLFQLAAVLGVVGALLLFIAPESLVWVAFIGAALFGMANGSCNTVMWNMEADSVDYGEWKTQIRSEGTTYAAFSFLRKLSQAIGGSAGAWIIGWFGYAGQEATQTDGAQIGIRVAVGAMPVVVMLAAIVIMAFYPMRDVDRRRMVEELDARKEQASSGPQS